MTARNGELIPGAPAGPRELARFDEMGGMLVLRVRFRPARGGKGWLVEEVDDVAAVGAVGVGGTIEGVWMVKSFGVTEGGVPSLLSTGD